MDDLKVLHKSNFFELAEFEGYEFINAGSTIAVLPVLVPQRKVILRNEYLPCWKYQEPHRDIFLTCVTGQVEDGESTEEAVLRELCEETGIIPGEDYKVLRGRSMYVGKMSNMTVTPFILLLSSFQMVEATGDGSVYEAKSSPLAIDLNLLDKYKVDDLVTNYLIMLLAQSFS